MLKTCPKCLQEKTKELAFYKHSSYCKPCENKRAREYAKVNKDKIKLKLKGYSLKRRYKISEQDYMNLIQKQNNLCAICNCLETAIDSKLNLPKALAVDHCHTTGKVRGLLCSKCNTGLGYFKDNVTYLKKAIEYLGGN